MIRSRSLLALTAAELVSRLRSQFTSLALPWFVLVRGLFYGIIVVVAAILAHPPAVAQEAA